MKLLIIVKYCAFALLCICLDYDAENPGHVMAESRPDYCDSIGSWVVLIGAEMALYQFT